MQKTWSKASAIGTGADGDVGVGQIARPHDANQEQRRKGKKDVIHQESKR